MRHSKFIAYLCLYIISMNSNAQMISIVKDTVKQKIIINAGDKPFTELIYSDSIEKPVLFPVYAANGELITRGFPLAPRPHEPVDHPHHIGLWMNYESVNGLDFWNNSPAIAADKKAKYGWIKTTAVTNIKSGQKGMFSYNANWQDIHNNVLLEENTTFNFTARNDIRIIDRITTLTAKQDVAMPDIKDGFLGLRVAHELELPSKEEKLFTDNKGNVTKVKSADDGSATGNYITSRGYKGDSAWGTRAEWCMLYGKKGNDSISIIIMDHPKNTGYPTYWHARGYGLFAANPLGQKIFSKGKEELNYSLKKGESVNFKYRIVIASGEHPLSTATIEMLQKEFIVE